MRQPAVNVTILMEKLVAIEHALGEEADWTIRRMILDAQDCLVELQRQWLALPRMPRARTEASPDRHAGLSETRGFVFQGYSGNGNSPPSPCAIRSSRSLSGVANK